MQLAFDDHRIDHRADVVHRRVADQLDDAGVRIDLDLGDVGAAWKGEVDGVVIGLLLEPGLQTSSG